MRLTWTAASYSSKQDEGQTCRSSGSLFCPMLVEIRGENSGATAFPPQDYPNILKAKGLVKSQGSNTIKAKGSIFTLTVGSATSLPTSLLIDTQFPQPIFIHASKTSSYSSSYAVRAALPALVLVAAPMAIVLPAINA